MSIFQTNYKLIAIDLSKQIELENSDLKQKIILFIFFIIEKSEETTFEFSQNSVSII